MNLAISSSLKGSLSRGSVANADASQGVSILHPTPNSSKFYLKFRKKQVISGKKRFIVVNFTMARMMLSRSAWSMTRICPLTMKAMELSRRRKGSKWKTETNPLLLWQWMRMTRCFFTFLLKGNRVSRLTLNGWQNRFLYDVSVDSCDVRRKLLSAIWKRYWERSSASRKLVDSSSNTDIIMG